MITSIDDPTQAELVKELSHGKVAEINDVQKTIFHRGNDGRVRHLCGPRINSIIARPKINYMMHSLDSKDVIDSLEHGPVRMKYRVVPPYLVYGKTGHLEGSVCRRKGKDQIGFNLNRQLKSCQRIVTHQTRKHR